MPAPRNSAIDVPVRALRIACALAMLVTAGAARAQAPARANVFEVRGVAVDLVASAQSQPRDAALVEGQRRAAQQLFERLVPLDQIARVPRLTNAQLADLVETFEIQSERLVGPRWIGSFAVAFRPEGVRGVLRDAGVAFAETVARPLVVVPVFTGADGAARLWSADNPWLAAWRRAPSADGLQPLIVPRGDDADQIDLTAAAALAGDGQRLAALARRYGTGGAAVVAAKLEGGVVSVATTRRDAGGAGETVIESVAPRAGETPDALLTRAATEAARGLNERWKTSVLVDTAREAKLLARVPLRGLADWIAVRARLGDLPMIRGVTLVSLTRERAVIEIDYAGDETTLRTVLAQRDLALDAEASGSAEPRRLSFTGRAE